MAVRRVWVIINGATGRMGTTQHLRNLMAIRAEGGLALAGGDLLVPEPVLVGRDAGRLAALADANGGLAWTTDLGAALAGPAEIFMDCGATGAPPASTCMSRSRRHRHPLRRWSSRCWRHGRG